MRVLVRKRDEHGAIAIMTALLALMLLVIAAFTIDLGMAYVTKLQLSTASDAASLAGSATYKKDFVGVCSPAKIEAQDTVRQAAEIAADDLFVQNLPKGTAAEGEITDVTCAGTGVRVTYTASGTSPSPLGVLADGSGTIETEGKAAAAYALGAGICAMCVIGDVSSGNADLTVTGGDIYVDGNVDTGPNSVWSATNSITITGSVSGLSQATPDWTDGPPIADPFADVALPEAPWAGLSTKTGSPCTGGPGVYDSWNVKNEVCVLKPGPYVFTGALTFQNTSSRLTSNGQPVTLFFDGPDGKLDAKNGQIYDMAAPTPEQVATSWPAGWPPGFVIIYDRDNGQNLELQGNGDGGPNLIGAVYALKATIAFNGTSCFHVSKGPMVIGGIAGNGNTGCVKLDETENAGIGTPTGLHLVE